jgi:hypothetical protein
MAYKQLAIILALAAAASPASATSPELEDAVAPAGTPSTKYCLRVEMLTGSILETVECWTRDEWADQEVDVDKEWAKEGVALISDGVRTPAVH